jgi:predicted metal-dependent peptidase
MLTQPYLASAVARLPLREVAPELCETMATDGYHIFVNASFVEKLAEEEIQFVLAHELLHCLLGHIDRRGDRGAWRWNAAVDFATNGLLVELGWTMPDAAEGIYEKRFRGMTAEAIYDELPEGLGFPPSFGGFDLHLSPSSPLSLSHGTGIPSADERRRLRLGLASALRSHLPGNAAGFFEDEIRAAASSEVPWPQLLARFVGGLRRSDFRWMPFNRKHLWRGYYLPSVDVPGPEHLVVAVDTSGSMSCALLAQVACEIDALRSAGECRVTLVQSDVEVQKVESFDPWERLEIGRKGQAGQASPAARFHGRGGTDLRAPFAWLAAEDRAGRLMPPPDAMVVVTDGFGPMPEAPPPCPVLWLLAKHGVPEVPFGAVARLGSFERGGHGNV